MEQKGLVWIREDLRLDSNTALINASINHDKVSAIYLYNKEHFDNKREAQKWWISKSLESLESELEKFNINLEIIFADELQFFSDIKDKNIFVYWNKVYEPFKLDLDKKIIKVLDDKKIRYKNFKGNILNEFQTITKKDGTPFKVFSPFWRHAEQVYLDSIKPKEKKIRKLKKKIKIFSTNVSPKNILPKKNWYLKFENYWKVSEKESHNQLNKFLADRVFKYSNDRDFPSLNGSSKISPYLRNGLINVNTVWSQCSKLKNKNISVKKYLNELGWREFSHSLINYFPEMLKGNLRKEFDKFPWEKNQKNLKAWKNGLTGYPIVDAGMRQMYETGWMHNRIRMVVGSFLVKHLRIDWREGEKYFRNCLLDFNEANNVAQWQWVAGCGADAAPYFRIFNPILQGEKFDKNGEYVKKWVPELKNYPTKYIHKPWELDIKYQESLKIIIGKDYPAPIVVHEKARKKALDAFHSLKRA